MKTTIYLIRHSIRFNNDYIEELKTSQSKTIISEKSILNVEGEKRAEILSNENELQNLDVIYVSNCVRTLQTAKYIIEKQNLKVNIDERFGERKFGINSWDELPTNFGERQFSDFDYKIENGESLNDVIKREEKALNDILNNYKEKKILIVGHSTALAALFSKWCKISYDGPYIYNDKEFFDGKWNHCEAFKLEFDNDNNLISIMNIK